MLNAVLKMTQIKVLIMGRVCIFASIGNLEIALQLSPATIRAQWCILTDLKITFVSLSLLTEVRNCLKLEKRMKAKTVHFTKGKPFWTKSNEIIYKLYLTSPKKCSYTVISSFLI